MRIKQLQIFFIIIFILLGVFLYYLQIVKGSIYRELSYRNSIRLLRIDAPRGTIYDRKDKVLADNALSFGVFIVPQEIRDLDLEIKKLAEILDLPESLLRRNYKRNYLAPFAPTEVIRNISKKKAVLAGELKLDLPGVLVKEVPSRRYPYNEATTHVLGYIGEIDKRELGLLRSYGYNAKDLIGKDGIEKIADGFLRGKNGGMQIQIDSRGRQVRVISEKQAEKGGDVFLTIDGALQSFLWKMMKDKKGVAIFMDPHSGEVLSLVSSPSYDPTDSLAKPLGDKDKPLLNRAIMGQYPPGSLFKIIVALAALETGKARPENIFMCRGRLRVGRGVFNCWNRDGHGPMDLRRAIIESCNVHFYNIGILLGVKNISEYAGRFGLGKKTGIDLLGELEGIVPNRTWKRVKKNDSWYTGDTANLSIGQGYLLATPLQAVRAIACVANGGNLIQPYILDKIGEKRVGIKRNKKLKIKEQNLELVRGAMLGVVEHENGTGGFAWSSKVSICGKTGTSQAGTGQKSHAWFAGFAPAKNPEIAFVIFLEHGGSGGDMPALMARKAVEFWHQHK